LQKTEQSPIFALRIVYGVSALYVVGVDKWNGWKTQEMGKIYAGRKRVPIATLAEE
jgi:hypothetical protein